MKTKFKIGQKVKIVKGIRDDGDQDYYNGGTFDTVPLNTTGKIVEIEDPETNIVVELDDTDGDSWSLHPKEIIVINDLNKLKKTIKKIKW